MPFEDYKIKFNTKTCPKPGYHKIAILEGRQSYQICGPFFQHHFQVIEVDDGDDDVTADRSNVRCSIKNKNNNVWTLSQHKTNVEDNNVNDITRSRDSLLGGRRRRRQRRRILSKEISGIWMDC